MMDLMCGRLTRFRPVRAEMFIEPRLLPLIPRSARSEMFIAAGFFISHSSFRSGMWKPMANTYSQIYIQTVFAVEGRLSLIRPEFKEDLYKYITGIVQNQGQKLIAINGMSDHVHILIGLRPAMALANIVKEVNADSTNFIIRTNGFVGDLIGKRAMAPSRTVILNWTQSLAIYKIRKSIIGDVLSKMNISHG